MQVKYFLLGLLLVSSIALIRAEDEEETEEETVDVDKTAADVVDTAGGKLPKKPKKSGTDDSLAQNVIDILVENLSQLVKDLKKAAKSTKKHGSDDSDDSSEDDDIIDKISKKAKGAKGTADDAEIPEIPKVPAI